MEYLKKLEDGGFIDRTKVTQYQGLLEHWAHNANKSKHLDFFIRVPKEVMRSIELKYALTTYIGENALNHYLFPTRWDLYIDRSEIQEWKGALAKHGLVGAGNVRLLLHDEHAMYSRMKLDGLWIASPPQVMVDLKREGGVCGEAYELMVERHVSRL